jgi:hypothetical protein
MLRFPLLVLVVTLATPTFARDVVHDAGTYAMNETTTRPWSAPVGHRQPRVADVPASGGRDRRSQDQRRLSRLLRLGRGRSVFPSTQAKTRQDSSMEDDSRGDAV